MPKMPHIFICMPSTLYNLTKSDIRFHQIQPIPRKCHPSHISQKGMDMNAHIFRHVYLPTSSSSSPKNQDSWQTKSILICSETIRMPYRFDLTRIKKERNQFHPRTYISKSLFLLSSGAHGIKCGII